MPSARTNDFVKQVQAIRADARELVSGLTEEQLNWKPAPSKWSIAQNLDHLTRTVDQYPQKIHQMIAESKARVAAGRKEYREGFIASFVLKGMEPPPKMRVKTSKFAEPPSLHRKDVVIAEFDDAHRRLEEAIAATDGVSLGHARMPSPFAKLVLFTLHQAIVVNLSHGRRHLWQARQVRNALPSAAGSPR
jgi:hypothetical protein